MISICSHYRNCLILWQKLIRYIIFYFRISTWWKNHRNPLILCLFYGLLIFWSVMTLDWSIMTRHWGHRPLKWLPSFNNNTWNTDESVLFKMFWNRVCFYIFVIHYYCTVSNLIYFDSFDFLFMIMMCIHIFFWNKLQIFSLDICLFFFLRTFLYWNNFYHKCQPKVSALLNHDILYH